MSEFFKVLIETMTIAGNGQLVPTNARVVYSDRDYERCRRFFDGFKMGSRFDGAVSLVASGRVETFPVRRIQG